MERDKQTRTEIINGREFTIVVLPTKNPDIIRNQIGERPEGMVGNVGRKGKIPKAKKPKYK